jgi:ATP-dependent Clp protease ATP-binding subunit ClpB
MANRPFDEVREAVLAVLRDHFRPEFLNRVDDIIVFKPLTQEQLGAIIDIQLARLQKRLDERKIVLDVTPAARKLLIERGWDPVYGARPLKRAIQRLVQDPLALLLLEGKFSDGDVVVVDPKGGELTFEKAKARAAAPVA